MESDDDQGSGEARVYEEFITLECGCIVVRRYLMTSFEMGVLRAHSLVLDEIEDVTSEFTEPVAVDVAADLSEKQAEAELGGFLAIGRLPN